MTNKKGDGCLSVDHTKQAFGWTTKCYQRAYTGYFRKNRCVAEGKSDKDGLATASLSQPIQHVFEVGRGELGKVRVSDKG